MRCHYEVLDVARDATADDIKKAYKKLAIKWHPDKNIDNQAEATEQFQIIQQAFEVLFDPHERAWYDDHRDAILKGKVGSQCDDDSLDVYQYFSASCYKGFGDDENGFYAIYREVFNKIAAEDSEYRTEDSDFEIPNFGKSTSSYEEVKSFYAYWQSYCTRKTFSWLDPYDSRTAENRKISRLIDKENKKVRDKARKARNEEIRELVKFVRKRDKRVEAHIQYLQEVSAEKAKKTEEKRREKIQERKAELSSQQESEWAKFSNLEDQLKGIEANCAAEFGDTIPDENTTDEETVENSLYCVACNKLFKTPKAFENHESSKKHKDNVLLIKQDMEESDDEIDTASEVEYHSSNSDEELANNETDSLSEPDEERVNESDDQLSENQDKSNEEGSCTDEELLGSDIEKLSTISDTTNEKQHRYRCRICNVSFDSATQHEQSKQHTDNYIQAIQKKTLSEESEEEYVKSKKSLNKPQSNDFNKSSSNTSQMSFKDETQKLVDALEKLSNIDHASLKQKVDNVYSKLDSFIKKSECSDSDYTDLSDELFMLSSQTSSRKNKNKKQKEPTTCFVGLDSDFELSDDLEDFSLGKSKKQKKKLKNKKQLMQNIKEKTVKSNNIITTPSELQNTSSDINSKTLISEETVNEAGDGLRNAEIIGHINESLDKKNSKKNQGKNNTNKISNDISTLCAVCKTSFPSKNKLFQHLTKTGHSVHIPEKGKSDNVVLNKENVKKGKKSKK